MSVLQTAAQVPAYTWQTKFEKAGHYRRSCMQGLIRGSSSRHHQGAGRKGLNFQEILPSALTHSLIRAPFPSSRQVSSPALQDHIVNLLSRPNTMSILALSRILALFAIGSCSASAPIEARQATVAVYVLSGFTHTGGPNPNYTVSVPENGVTFPISRSPLLPSKPTTSANPGMMNRYD